MWMSQRVSFTLGPSFGPTETKSSGPSTVTGILLGPVDYDSICPEITMTWTNMTFTDSVVLCPLTTEKDLAIPNYHHLSSVYYSIQTCPEVCTAKKTLKSLTANITS